jgi:DNA-binding transcriptional MerR regulator
MRSGLTIGDFSQITHLSVKTLRHYHEAGLLEPADIDPQSGYRYYSTEQVPTAQVIRRFRDLGMPVREVGEVLATADPSARSALIANYLERLENQLDETRAAVTSLRRLLAPTAPPIQVELRAQPATMVASIHAVVERGDILAWYGDAMAELRNSRGPRRQTGPAGGLYDNELFTEDRGRAVVYLPMADPPSVGRVTPFVIPAVELALTLHCGSHDDIDVSYGALGSWVAEQALAVAGPVHEIYLVGPADTASAGEWRTEIGWPIFRTSPS